MKIIYLIAFGYLVFFVFSCNNNRTVEKKGQFLNKNSFPIEFVGEKILKYNKPHVLPQGGAPINQDTLKIYSVSNKSKDTVWVETVPRQLGRDSLDGYLIFRNIKTIYRDHIARHSIKDNQWWFSSDGNGCWGGCNDSVKLLPNENMLFHYGIKRYKENFDSVKFSIVVKIKKGKFNKDSVVYKKLILKNNYFIEG